MLFRVINDKNFQKLLFTFCSQLIIFYRTKLVKIILNDYNVIREIIKIKLKKLNRIFVTLNE